MVGQQDCGLRAKGALIKKGHPKVPWDYAC